MGWSLFVRHRLSVGHKLCDWAPMGHRESRVRRAGDERIDQFQIKNDLRPSRSTLSDEQNTRSAILSCDDAWCLLEPRLIREGDGPNRG